MSASMAVLFANHEVWSAPMVCHVDVITEAGPAADLALAALAARRARRVRANARRRCS